MKKALFLFLFLAHGITAQIVYKDVAGIFYNRCTSCHNQYSHSASLMSYSEVYAKAYAMQAYLNANDMPLWAPDTNYTRFRNEHTISQSEKTAILNWIAGGTQSGDTTQAPPQPFYTRYKLNGTPDLELTIPAFTNTISNDDLHTCFALPTGLIQDRIIRAFEIVPGNATMVHHVIVAIDSTGTQTTDTSGVCYTKPFDWNIGAYSPGCEPSVFPANGQMRSGIRLKSGSNIMLNMHYAAGTMGQTDSTKIRIYLYPQATTGIRPVRVVFIRKPNFSIPADTVITIGAQYPTGSTLQRPLTLLASFPHSHRLCTSIVDFASSLWDTIPLIRINKWNPDWQGWYTYNKPVKVDVGYNLITRHTFDNTAANPLNPFTPPQVVNSGPTNDDEMLIDAYQYLDYQNGDEYINLDSILSVDPLLTPYSVHTFENSPGYTYAFPNPFEKSTTIHYELKAACDVNIRLYNSTGELVDHHQSLHENAGKHEFTWNALKRDGSALADGIYYYTLRAGALAHGGKFILTRP